MNRDDICKYLESGGINRFKRTEDLVGMKVFDYGISTIQTAGNVSKPSEDASASSTGISLSASSTPIVSNLLPLYDFVKYLCPDKVDKILTDDVLKHQSFTTIMLPVARSFLYYLGLKNTYESKRKRRKDTNLTKHISDIHKASKTVTCALAEVSEVSLPLTLGVQLLASRALHKVALITEVIKVSIDLKKLVSNRYLLNSLRRRLSQKKKAQELFTIECMNSSKFAWQDAFHNLCDIENSGHVASVHAPLSLLQLIEVGKVLEESISLFTKEILPKYSISSDLVKDVCTQLIKYFPVWWLHSSSEDAVINVHEFLLLPGSLESLLCINMEPPVCTTTRQRRRKSIPSDRSPVSKTHHLKPGRPSLISKFPQIVELASEFMDTQRMSAKEKML